MNAAHKMRLLCTILALLWPLFPAIEGFTVPLPLATSATYTRSISGPAVVVDGFHSVVFPDKATSSTALFGKKAARSKANEAKKKKGKPISKPKDDVIQVEAVVLESLPNAMFRCAICDSPDTQPPILATINGRIRKSFIKILVGDRVLVELSPYDVTRGRISYRYR